MTDPTPHIVIILGTRPEIIKLSPVIKACERRQVQYTLIHTGQHYSDELDDVFFKQLDLPEPDVNLGVGSSSHGKQTGEMIVEIEDHLVETEPDIVLVQGDTNSVLAGAIAASKLPISLGHVEAGLRSFDREMPEETNRVITDHVGDYLFAPTPTAASYLYEEGIDEDRIYTTGNTVVDAIENHSRLAASRSSILSDLDIQQSDYLLLTAHRAENVDSAEQFSALLAGVERVASDLELEGIYPIHPRARNNLEQFGITPPEHIRLVEPQDYLDFIKLETHASLILTDSGGVQEEACILGVPCVTLRENTERPETLDVGANRTAGTDPDMIHEYALEMYGTAADWENPFGDGTAAEQILQTVIDDTE